MTGSSVEAKQDFIKNALGVKHQQAGNPVVVQGALYPPRGLRAHCRYPGQQTRRPGSPSALLRLISECLHIHLVLLLGKASGNFVQWVR